MPGEEPPYLKHFPLTENDRKVLEGLKDWLSTVKFEEQRYDSSTYSLCTKEELDAKLKLLATLDLARVDWIIPIVFTHLTYQRLVLPQAAGVLNSPSRRFSICLIPQSNALPDNALEILKRGNY